MKGAGTSDKRMFLGWRKLDVLDAYQSNHGEWQRSMNGKKGRFPEGNDPQSQGLHPEQASERNAHHDSAGDVNRDFEQRFPGTSFWLSLQILHRLDLSPNDAGEDLLGAAPANSFSFHKLTPFKLGRGNRQSQSRCVLQTFSSVAVRMPAERYLQLRNQSGNSCVNRPAIGSVRRGRTSRRGRLPPHRPIISPPMPGAFAFIRPG